MTRTFWNESKRKTISKKRSLVPGGRKHLKRKTKGGQRGDAIPIGLIGSAAAPLAGELIKPLFKFLVEERGVENNNETKHTAKTTCNISKS